MNNTHQQPSSSKALPWENIISKCWKPDCKKVATCRDGSGWEWCDDHVDQEKTRSVLHTAQEHYDVDYYQNKLRSLLTSHSEAIRERVEGLVERMNWDIAACSQFPESESHTYAKVYMQIHRDDILALLTDEV